MLNWVSNVISCPPAKGSVAMGLINGVGSLGTLCICHLVSGGMCHYKILTGHPKDRIIYMASQLWSSVPPVDDYRALLSSTFTCLGFWYVRANPHSLCFCLG